MTTEDAGKLKIMAQYEIFKILKDLMDNTNCKISGISLTTEEGFGYESEVLIDVEIKLMIR